ncbi:dihydroorotate dehydrogenase (quinone) [Helicobacter heilmannii]|uniref:dihydroorotate dehydrogenase (quinone) n=1 Tax=Helicobacter heilmannii TaxID=35817 RepID=UPI0006A0F3E9|nr:dihydroorotate dehydrogenase (quinone) [Helicobacter heilmannii]CRF45463.1 Dihydroorotate dehydrogenase [Helicobacter heilmannii]CRF47519.1 Dihydroorotate dehydrogenase [Helicobacter heilmannii]CRF49131.1 Dihydroorotate dehydrogenase [Helicobacter heilmannii]
MTPKWLFALEAERAHALVGCGLKIWGKLPHSFRLPNPALTQEILGLSLPNPIGLAAGFDKNATMVVGLSHLGFGAIEVGTLTPKPQPGNPKPRVFRYIEEQSLQNSMGFNNTGVKKAVQRLDNLPPISSLIGVNLGKNKDTPLANALSDYEKALDASLGVGDYYVFNLSSPNTPNLRDLQNEGFVGELFAMALERTHKPLFLKVAPDMPTDALLAVCERALQAGARGLIATNTTIDYSLLPGARTRGGLSGRVLQDKARAVFEKVAEAFFGKAILVAVGGISNGQEAYERIKMGAHFVQIFTAFIYQGPSICRQINQDIVKLLQQDGLSSIHEAVGIGRKR